MAQSLPESAVGLAACKTLTTNKRTDANERTAERHARRQRMHMISTLLVPPPHASCFHETLTNSQTGPVRMSPTCCVSAVQTWLSVKLPASHNNQSLRHKQIKHKLYRSPGNVSKTPWYTHSAPGLHPSQLVLLRAKTVQTVATKQGNTMCTVARYVIYSLIVFCKSFFCQQRFSQRATHTDSDDRGCWCDQQAVRRSRGNSISHQYGLNFWEAVYVTVSISSFNTLF